MKNIFYLFLAVTLFSCSDDDSSDTNDNNSNQTFLERFDGVVWENDLFDPSDQEQISVIPVTK